MKKQIIKETIVFIAIIALLVLLYDLISGSNDSKPEKEVSFSEFLTAANFNQIKEAAFQETPGKLYLINYTDKNGNKFKTQGVVSDDLSKLMSQNGVKISFKKQPDNSLFAMFFAYVMPYIIIIAIVWFVLKRSGGIGGNSGNPFSRFINKTEFINTQADNTSFKDFGGSDEAVEEAQEVIQFLKKPFKYQKIGAKPPKGVLLMGPSGTGKTLLAKAIAREAGVDFISYAGSAFVEMFVGVGAARVRDVFTEAKKRGRCIIFIDEIDALGKSRLKVAVGGGTDEREQTLNQLLIEMDGFKPTDGIVLIAATNRPDMLDSALLRPGRFDRKIYLRLPDVNGRRQILRIHLKNIRHDPNLDIDKIVGLTPGFSGADIANLVNEAALIAVRYNKEMIEMDDIVRAIDRVSVGLIKKVAMSDKERRIIAYHESGHAIVAKVLGETVARVSIISAGPTAGYTRFSSEDKYIYSKSDIIKIIQITYGGYCAEKLFCGGENSSGCTGDIEWATSLAYNMVKTYGMNDIAPIFFGDNYAKDYVGKWSDETTKLTDQAIIAILNKAVEMTTEILKDNIDKVEKLAAALLKKEVLTGDEMNEIIGLI